MINYSFLYWCTSKNQKINSELKFCQYTAQDWKLSSCLGLQFPTLAPHFDVRCWSTNGCLKSLLLIATRGWTLLFMFWFTSVLVSYLSSCKRSTCQLSVVFCNCWFVFLAVLPPRTLDSYLTCNASPTLDHRVWYESIMYLVQFSFSFCFYDRIFGSLFKLCTYRLDVICTKLVVFSTFQFVKLSL